MTVDGSPGAPHLVSWAQIILILAAYIGSLIFFMGTTQESQRELNRALDGLGQKVEVMGTAVNHLANTEERLDEHMKSVDRRLDILEKDKTIESYKRN